MNVSWARIVEVAELPVRIVFLVLLAIFARWAIFRVIDRLTTSAGTPPQRLLGSRKAADILLKNGLVSERQAQRAKALGSLMKSITTGVIGITTLAMVLELLGYELAPLIASAGVAGVALGFGAQSLVKDFIAGIFMLLEDQFGVGDYVDMDKASGTVEAVGLRVTRLRDQDGVVWHVRNGEVLRVGNKSMGWSALTLDVVVAYDEDIPRVQELLDSVGAAVAADPRWEGKIIQPPRAVGIQEITASTVTLRMFGQCAPSEKADVERALRLRIKAAFDGEKIRLPE
ncbi:MAG TPA: mechanosensitive ion channel family protein [Actinopolymorphaceae bacterium]